MAAGVARSWWASLRVRAARAPRLDRRRDAALPRGRRRDRRRRGGDPRRVPRRPPPLRRGDDVQQLRLEAAVRRARELRDAEQPPPAHVPREGLGRRVRQRGVGDPAACAARRHRARSGDVRARARVLRSRRRAARGRARRRRRRRSSSTRRTRAATRSSHSRPCSCSSPLLGHSSAIRSAPGRPSPSSARSACTRCRSWSIRSAARCSGFSCRAGSRGRQVAAAPHATRSDRARHDDPHAHSLRPGLRRVRRSAR